MSLMALVTSKRFGWKISELAAGLFRPFWMPGS
jgi:hypothetical protein